MQSALEIHSEQDGFLRRNRKGAQLGTENRSQRENAFQFQTLSCRTVDQMLHQRFRQERQEETSLSLRARKLQPAPNRPFVEELITLDQSLEHLADKLLSRRRRFLHMK